MGGSSGCAENAPLTSKEKAVRALVSAVHAHPLAGPANPRRIEGASNNQEVLIMRRLMKLSLAGGALALCLGASVASAAPAASSLAGDGLRAVQSSQVERVHDFGRRNRGFGFGFRRCHWERVCWIDRWGYRHCDFIRRCHSPRWW